MNMRDAINLVEGTFPKAIPLDYDHKLWGKMKTTIITNPAPASLKRLSAQAKEGQLRGVSAKGHVFIWPAYEATHSSVREILELGQPAKPGCGGDFWIVPEGTDPFSDDWPGSDGEPTKKGIAIIRGRGVEDSEPMRAIMAWFGDQ